jgi:hypothetical protein
MNPILPGKRLLSRQLGLSFSDLCLAFSPPVPSGSVDDPGRHPDFDHPPVPNSANQVIEKQKLFR